MCNKKFQSEKSETELQKRLENLLEFLKYKNHGFCIKYLKKILKDFFKNRNRKY